MDITKSDERVEVDEDIVEIVVRQQGRRRQASPSLLASSLALSLALYAATPKIIENKAKKRV